MIVSVCLSTFWCASRGPAVFIARPATRTATCVFAFVSSVVICVLAAGAMWKSRMTSAPWAAREGPSTVIDAAGAIYVIGGESGGNNLLNDVLKSADGGADRTRGVLRRLLGGTR